MLHYGLSKSEVLDEMAVAEVEYLLKVVRENQDSDLRLLALAYHDPKKLYEFTKGKASEKPRSALKKFADGLARLAKLGNEAATVPDADLPRKIELRTRAYELSQSMKNGE